jgi:anti-sigma B factor antagonist
MDLFEIQTEDLLDATLIRVRGEVDLATAPMLQNALQSAIASGRHVVVDLANATYMDLSGFRTLVEAKGALGERQALAVTASSPLVHKVIEIIELDTILPVLHSPQEALDFVRSRG